MTAIQQLLLNFDCKNPIENWEVLKSCIQTFCSTCTHFCQKQSRIELQALHETLKYINKQIFHKDVSLEADQLHIQSYIEQFQDSKFFFGSKDDMVLKWIMQGGKISPSFLHLEDIQNKTFMNKLWNGNTFVYSFDEILPILHEFYSHLYDKNSSASLPMIDKFLSSLTDLPHLDNCESLIGPITCKEIEDAIHKLNMGKSPGSDSLTTIFYKIFAEFLSPVLEEVYKSIFQVGQLSFTQCLAIIALIFKKGESWLVPNY